ncbi:MAG TPA: UvrB/UvrC motif-containing protein [Limnochordia bacterium]|nr:UvrB/UvrC motif-containing protein [Limnochordia bacterium]
MMCQECHQRSASVHFTKIVGGEKTEAHLCHECAQRHDEVGFVGEPTFTFNNILQSLFQSQAALTGRSPAVQAGVRCHSCGSSFADVRQRGRLGCGECYVQFAEQLEPLIRRIHSATQHVGKAPASLPQSAARHLRRLEELRTKLQVAIRQEAYETAAELRDEIRELERRLAEEG